jgi:hypothetical protein
MYSHRQREQFSTPASLQMLELLHRPAQASLDRCLVTKNPVENLGIGNGVSSD